MEAQTFAVPLSKLKPSPANVRRTGSDQGLAELAASIAAHGLINPLRVEPEAGADGAATGFYLVHAGERRRRALLHLAAAKRLKKSEPIPCLPRGASPAEEESLAENVNTAPMHPADQYEAFARLHRGQGLAVADIAARFGLPDAIVRQRLRLGAASPALMALYREGAMTLDQLMAFCLTDDHAAQERVWGELSWNKSPEMIRRLLTRSQVPASDRRAVFVGAQAYAAAGGEIVRDLFTEDGGGWFADSTLLDRLVSERLAREAGAVRGEGWLWVEAAAEFPYARAGDMARVWPDPVQPSDEEVAQAEALRERYNALEDEYARLPELPDEVCLELQRIEDALAAIEGREAYAPEDLARAGAFVCLGHDGTLRVERGYVRPEDMPAPEPEPEPVPATLPAAVADDTVSESIGEGGTGPAAGVPEPQGEPEDDGPAGIPDRLLEELTAHRTLALQASLAASPGIALRAVAHVLALRAFYPLSNDPGSCLRVEPAPYLPGGLGDCRATRELAEAHRAWSTRLPRQAEGLWAWVMGAEDADVLALLACAAGRTLYAVRGAWGGDRRRLAHADALAAALGLDMAEWWAPTAERYLGRVTKATIRQAVAEGVGAREADALAGLRKAEMAAQAERLLAGTGWLPTALRTPGPVRQEGEAALARAAE